MYLHEEITPAARPTYWRVSFMLGNLSHTVSAHATEAEAAAQVSYLNGGLHPELAAMVLKLLPDLFRETLIDPRANLGARCVHGRRHDEPCEVCDLIDSRPPGTSV